MTQTKNKQPTALIAEDEPMLRAQRRARLTQAWPELAIVAEAENGEQALALQRELEPDIVFLDIRMPVKSGLEVAEALAGACHVVFVTAYDEYAVTAFEQGAVDYVLKPVTADRIVKVIERLKRRLERPPKYTKVVTADGEALIRKTIKELFDELDAELFWQVHRGTIVNLRAIARVDRDYRDQPLIILKQRPERLTVSRSFAHLFKAM